MTASELIQALSKLPDNTPVLAWDYDDSEYAEIIGLEWEFSGSWVYVTTHERD